MALFEGKSTKLAVILAILMALGYSEVDPETWKAEESAMFAQTSSQLFDYVTNPDNIPEVITTLLTGYTVFS
jgi:hypothetical protein